VSARGRWAFGPRHSARVVELEGSPHTQSAVHELARGAPRRKQS
jgi:hypothetical protein